MDPAQVLILVPQVGHALERVVLNSSDLILEREPVVAKATSFFFDVRGSSLPLTASPEQRSKLYRDLRRVLSIVTDAVFESGGTIIDYAGDGVFAVWGVPLPQLDQADRAVSCARRVVQRLCEEAFLV